MPYYIFVVSGDGRHKTAELLNQFEHYRDAKNEVKRLRIEEPLPEEKSYRINFSASETEAEKNLTEYREEPIVKEWEK